MRQGCSFNFPKGFLVRKLGGGILIGNLEMDESKMRRSRSDVIEVYGLIRVSLIRGLLEKIFESGLLPEMLYTNYVDSEIYLNYLILINQVAGEA